MGAVIHTTRASAWLHFVPAPLLAVLDAWSQRVASRKAQARRLAQLRKTAPLPPVVTGPTYLPHPWRD